MGATIRGGMRTGTAVCAVVFGFVLASQILSAGQAAASAAADPAATPERGVLVTQYCLTCHSDRVKAGGLGLSSVNFDAPTDRAEVAEKVIRKLRSGMMPPPGAKRPDSQTMAAFIASLENEID